MNGKTVLITGGTGGIGKYTAIGLVKLGAKVVVSGRDKARGRAGVQEIQQASGNADVHLLLSDLSSMAGARTLAQDFQSQFGRLDVLVNNAGLLEGQRRLTADGIEAHFAVNVVAPYLLTLRLLPTLEASTPARVINLTGGMPGSHLKPDDLLAEKSFVGLFTYTRAKAAMSAMSLELAKRLEGTGVSVNVVYPGSAATSMTGAMTPEMVPPVMRLLWPVFKNIQKPDGGKGAEKASRSSVYAASSPELDRVTGAYISTNSKRIGWPADLLKGQNRQTVMALLERLTDQAAPTAAARGRLELARPPA